MDGHVHSEHSIDSRMNMVSQSWSAAGEGVSSDLYGSQLCVGLATAA